jgi:hypothetical protein
VKKREKRGIGPAAAQSFEALLAPAHAGQPVVDENDTGRRCIHAAASLPAVTGWGNPDRSVGRADFVIAAGFESYDCSIFGG